MKETKVATPREMRDMVAGTRTDDPFWFEYESGTVSPEQLTALLSEHLSETRRAVIEAVLDRRTESVAVVVEGLVDVGNVSAILRTADGFGIQRVHAVDSAGKYKRSKRTTKGADKWVDRYRWDTTEECFSHLRSDGYRIIADVSLEPHFGIQVHGSQFPHVELATVQPISLLAKQSGAGAYDLDADRGPGQDG